MPFHICPKQTNKKQEEMGKKARKEEHLTKPPHITMTYVTFHSLTHVHQHTHDDTAAHLYIYAHTVTVRTHTLRLKGWQPQTVLSGHFSFINWSIFGSIKKSPLLALQSSRQISMMNLDKLLLAAAGLATTEENVHLSPPTHTRRRRRVSFADDVKDNDRTESSKKTSTSQVPSKKNLGILKRDDDRRIRRGCIEDSDDEIVVHDLCRDEDDREKLSKLSELEREMVLEACATEETDKNLTKILKKRRGEDERSSPLVHVRASRSKAERAGALAELVKRRRDAARRGSSCQCSSVNKIDLPAVNVGNSNLTSSNEEESSWDDMSSSDEDNKSPEPPTLREVMGITVPRSKLVQWYMEPFFNELITGCFVRILIGKGEAEAPVYRLCEVLNVDATDPDRQYEFDNKTTCKYLNLVWGNGSPARWQMAVASNSPPRKVEFDQWLREVKLTGGRMPTKQELLEKRQALEKVNSFVYSAATVKQMVEEKRSAGWKPANIAAERARLRRELELASDDDEVELKRIRARMQELDAVREGSRGSRKKALMVDELNKKNLLENFINSSSKTVSAKSSDDYDPFSRRWTRPGSFFTSSSSAGAAAGTAPISASADTHTVAAAPPPGDAAGQGELADTTVPLDEECAPHVLHDFDESIPLAALEKFGGARGAKAGYMARKQHIEATVGVKVAEDDGKSHPHTMTVAEYKKRIGLI